jgi:hypothetical protein
MSSEHPIGRLELSGPVVDELRAMLPSVAARTVAALTAEVAEYRHGAVGAEAASTIPSAVELALDTFLRLATDPEGDGAGRVGPMLEAAYALGRGEARAGRTMGALLAAYRVGARTAWQELSARLVRRQVSAATIAQFAALVFAYIDELSGASAAGHRDELATSGRVREQLLEQLAQAIVAGEPPDRLAERAERAAWSAPDTLTAVALRVAYVGNAAQLLDPRTLRLTGDMAPGLASHDLASHDLAVLLVPDAHRSRAALRAALVGRGAVIGPTRPWTDAHVSYRRVLRALELVAEGGNETIDTDDHLVELVATADRDAFDDLRTRALRPLAQLRPEVRARLTETLRSWLLHQGRREEVAAELNVHPQTVRYRMTQLRELFGERLTDPGTALELIVALSVRSGPIESKPYG